MMFWYVFSEPIFKNFSFRDQSLGTQVFVKMTKILDLQTKIATFSFPFWIAVWLSWIVAWLSFFGVSSLQLMKS